jgi:hypothetical protein
MRKCHLCLFLSQFVKFIFFATPFWAFYNLSFERKPEPRSQPILGACERFFGWKDEDNNRVNGKGNAENESSTIEKELKVEKA